MRFGEGEIKLTGGFIVDEEGDFSGAVFGAQFFVCGGFEGEEGLGSDTDVRDHRHFVQEFAICFECEFSFEISCGDEDGADVFEVDGGFGEVKLGVVGEEVREVGSGGWCLVEKGRKEYGCQHYYSMGEGVSQDRHKHFVEINI